MQSKRVILRRIEQIKKDARLHYGIATITENAPLALIQLAAMSELNTLESVLELPTKTTFATLDKRPKEDLSAKSLKKVE